MARQFLSVFLSHIVSVVLMAAFAFMFVAMIMDKPAAYTATSVVMSLIYFAALYSKGHELAGRDKLSYTTTSTYLFKGAVLSLPVLVWNFVLWLLYIFAWNCLTLDGMLSSATGIIYNIVYVLNTFMFSGLAEISGGKIAWHAHLYIYLIPFFAVTLGYIAGVYNFTIIEKLSPYIYEKKKKS